MKTIQSQNSLRPSRVAACLAGALSALCLLVSSAAAQVSFVNTTNYTMPAVGGDSPASVALADFNGDGLLDMVVANNFPGSVYVTYRLGNGDGTFGSASNLVVDSEPVFVTAADVNADGFADILSANPNTDNISVLFGLGNGTFVLRQDYDTVLGAAPMGVVTGDFNFDGTNDFVSANFGFDTVSIFTALGDDTFTNEFDYAVGDGPISITKGDFNFDGNRDIAVANNLDNTVSILLGYGDGSFAAAIAHSAGAGSSPVAIITDDFEHDNDTDLIIAKGVGNLVVGLTNNSFAVFSSAFSHATPSAPTSLAVADLNKDGTNDYIVALTGGSVRVRLGANNGFGVSQDFAVGTTPQSVAAASINGDQASDLIVANFGSDNVSILANLTPVAHAVTLTLLEDSTLNYTLGGTTNATLTFIVVSATTNGLTTTNVALPALTYTPNGDFFGTDHLRFKVTDGTITSAIATVKFTVSPVNDQPTFVVNPVVTVLEDKPAQSIAGHGSSIDKGAYNEGNQGLGFQVSNDNTSLFSLQPYMTSLGRLIFKSAVSSNGSANLVAILQDSGGTASGGVNTSTNNFVINVTAVNDVPTFTIGTNITVNEDSGPLTYVGWASNISTGPADETGQTPVTFTVTANSNPGIFSAAPAIDAAGDLTFTPAAHSNGFANITIRLSDTGDNLNGGTNTGLAKLFRITIRAANDAPSFTINPTNATINVLEDQSLQTFSNFIASADVGPVNESNQLALYYFIVTSADPNLFSHKPAVDHLGTLRFSPKPNSNGTTTVTVVMNDRGGVLYGGAATATNTFTIGVTAVNDAPSFSHGVSPLVFEDSGPATNLTWASSIKKGPPNESSQGLVFNITTDNPTLFAVQPAIDGTGHLTFTPATNASGSANMDVVIFDDGGIANGGVNNGVAQTVRVTVVPINDAPEFTLSTNQMTVVATNGLVTTNIFASFSGGPGTSESAQVLTFLISNNTNTALFITQPTINTAGILNYKPRGAAFTGEVTLSIRARDNGGTASGGTNQSPAQNFTIKVN